MSKQPRAGFFTRKNSNQMFNYIRDTKAEFKHVKWPSRRQAIAYGVFVIVFSLGTAVFLGAFDFAFSKLLKLFI